MSSCVKCCSDIFINSKLYKSFQGGGRKKKFAEDEDFDDSEEGSEMSDSEFEDPDEMEVGLNASNPKLCVPCVLLNMFM